MKERAERSRLEEELEQAIWEDAEAGSTASTQQESQSVSTEDTAGSNMQSCGSLGSDPWRLGLVGRHLPPERARMAD